MTTHDNTEELGAADTDRTGGTGARGIAAGGGRYYRVSPPRWKTVNIHGDKACPCCGSIVANARGKAAHEDFHGDAQEEIAHLWEAIFQLQEKLGIRGPE